MTNLKRAAVTALALLMLVSAASCGKKEETLAEHNKKLVSGEIDPDVEKVEKEATEEPAAVSVSVPEEELAALVDSADDEYASFEMIEMTDADFYVGKTMNVAAMLSDHDMTIIEKGAITLKITDTKLTFDYNTEEGEQKQSVYVYTRAEEVLTTDAGRDYTYVVYGTEPLEGGEVNGTVGIVSMIKMADTVDMGDNAADSYVLFEESGQPGTYYLLTLE